MRRRFGNRQAYQDIDERNRPHISPQFVMPAFAWTSGRPIRCRALVERRALSVCPRTQSARGWNAAPPPRQAMSCRTPFAWGSAWTIYLGLKRSQGHSWAAATCWKKSARNPRSTASASTKSRPRHANSGWGGGRLWLRLVRPHFNRLDVTAGVAAVGAQLGHRADTWHGADKHQTFAIAGAARGPLLNTNFHPANMAERRRSATTGTSLGMQGPAESGGDRRHGRGRLSE